MIRGSEWKESASAGLLTVSSEQAPGRNEEPLTPEVPQASLTQTYTSILLTPPGVSPASPSWAGATPGSAALPTPSLPGAAHPLPALSRCDNAEGGLVSQVTLASGQFFPNETNTS